MSKGWTFTDWQSFTCQIRKKKGGYHKERFIFQLFMNPAVFLIGWTLSRKKFVDCFTVLLKTLNKIHKCYWIGVFGILSASEPLLFNIRAAGCNPCAVFQINSSSLKRAVPQLVKDSWFTTRLPEIRLANYPGCCAKIRAVDPDPHGSAFIYPPGSGSRRVNLSAINCNFIKCY